MKINFRVVFFIIVVSSAIGLLTNSIRNDGIPLNREPVKIIWTDSTKNFADNYSIDTVKSVPDQKEDSDSSHMIKQNMQESIIAKEKSDDPQTAQKTEEINEPSAINLKQAYQLYKKGVIFLDARENEDYKAGHIKNALNLPYYDFELFEKNLDNIAKEDTIVTYCGGTDCDLSILLGNDLFESGYKNIYIFFGGWNDWLDAGYPIEE